MPATLAPLQEWYRTHRQDKGANALSGGGDDLAQWLAKTRDAAEHSVREPEVKVFRCRLHASGETPLVAARNPHGAMTKRAEFGTIRVLSPAGDVVGQGQYSTDDPLEFKCFLKGAAGDVFQVLVKDDLRSVWSLSGPGLDIFMRAAPGFCIGGVRRGRYHFFVPEGTQEFRVKVRGGHQGICAAVVLTPANKIAGFIEQANHVGAGLGALAARLSGAAWALAPAVPEDPAGLRRAGSRQFAAQGGETGDRQRA